MTEDRTPRTYTIWPLEFTPDPGPRRLYGDRPASRIKSVIVALTDRNGVDVEVLRLESPAGETELELLARAKQLSARHFLDTQAAYGPGAWVMASQPPSILAKLEAATFAVSPAYAREMSRNDNS